MSAWVVTMGAGATMGSCIRRLPFHPKERLGPKSITWASEMAKHNSGVMTTSESRSGSSTYWSRPQLVETLLDAVVAAGLDLRTATPEALAPLDQFHGGGKDATRALAGQAEVRAGIRVLDVGGGLGG